MGRISQQSFSGPLVLQYCLSCLCSCCRRGILLVPEGEPCCEIDMHGLMGFGVQIGSKMLLVYYSYLERSHQVILNFSIITNIAPHTPHPFSHSSDKVTITNGHHNSKSISVTGYRWFILNFNPHLFWSPVTGKPKSQILLLQQMRGSRG